MRRVRAVLAMMLAIGMAAHTLLARPMAPSDDGLPTAAVIVERETQLASFERDADEDELMAVDADTTILPVRASSH